MATLITTDYFKYRPNYIPGLEVNNGIPADLGSYTVEAVGVAIAQYEEEYLRKILGDALYDKYVSDMSADETKTIWDGFNALFQNTTSYSSAIADYVYFKYLGDSSVSFTGNGATLGTVDAKGNRVPIALLQVPTWNRMVRKNFWIFKWVVTHQLEFDPDELGSDENWDALLETINTAGI